MSYNETEKQFDLGAVLTVTTGVMLTTIEELYKILNHMTGDDLFTHQLPRASRACAPELLHQHPDLPTEVSPPLGITAELSHDQAQARCRAYVETQAQRFGESLAVSPLPAGDWEPRNPLEELYEMAPDKAIIPVVLGPETE